MIVLLRLRDFETFELRDYFETAACVIAPARAAAPPRNIGLRTYERYCTYTIFFFLSSGATEQRSADFL